MGRKWGKRAGGIGAEPTCGADVPAVTAKYPGYGPVAAQTCSMWGQTCWGYSISMRSLAIAALLTSGCYTGYHPKNFVGGYSEMRLNERAFEVSFDGNGYTSSGLARRYALRRAAELAVQMGYAGFWVAGENHEVSSSVYTTPVHCSSYGGSTTCSGGDSIPINKPSSTITINMVTANEARQPPTGIVVYDARMLLSQFVKEGQEPETPSAYRNH